MPIPLRLDFDAPGLRAIAKQTKAAGQARRLLALAAIYEGASRSEAAAIGSVTLQIVRDWVLKFNAEGPAGLIDRSPPGQPARLNAGQRAALARVIEDGPIPAVHGVVRWRLIDLCQWMWEEHRVSICKSTMSQEVRALGYRKLTARPRHHAQAEDAIETFKKSSLRAWRRSIASGTRHRHCCHRDLVCRRSPHRPEEQDHAPMGQAWQPAIRATRSTHGVDLHFWCGLSAGWQSGAGLVPALLQYPRDEPASCGDFCPGGPWQTRGADDGSSRLAHVGPTDHARQYHHPPAATEMSRAQPGRERLAVHEKQLALQPRVPPATRTSSIIAAKPGTNSQTSPGAS